MPRFEKRTGKVIASAGAMVIAAAGPLLLASQVSTATSLCSGDSSSGTCTLIDPGGRTSFGAISHQRDSSNGDLAITVPFTSGITDFHLCYATTTLAPYLPVPGENPSQTGITGRECTPNGPLVRQYGATRIGPDASVIPNPVSAGGTSTFLFTVPSGDYWYVHLVVDGNTLAASSPAPFGSSSTVTS